MAEIIKIQDGSTDVWPVNAEPSDTYEGYYKFSNGMMMQWGQSYIDINATQGDRKQITFYTPFTQTPFVFFQVLENAYTNNPSVFAWNSTTTYTYALNRASSPGRHVMFTWFAIGRWK